MNVCAIGKHEHDTVQPCCSTHKKLLCAHHYARTHFVETDPAWADDQACDLVPDQATLEET
jgi:hypothetical protein